MEGAERLPIWRQLHDEAGSARAQSVCRGRTSRVPHPGPETRGRGRERRQGAHAGGTLEGVPGRRRTGDDADLRRGTRPHPPEARRDRGRHARRADDRRHGRRAPRRRPQETDDPQDRLRARDGARPRSHRAEPRARPVDGEDAARGERQVQPPTADHVEAVLRLLPTKYRLPVLVLDATGMRIGELEALTWATWTSREAAGGSRRRRRDGRGG